jgi:hypothetical protein
MIGKDETKAEVKAGISELNRNLLNLLKDGAS